VISAESLDLRWWPIDALPADADAGLSRLVDTLRQGGQVGPSNIA
jgi:hypothetical protein